MKGEASPRGASQAVEESPPLDFYDANAEHPDAGGNAFGSNAPSSEGRRPYLGASYKELPLEEVLGKIPPSYKEFVEERLRATFVEARTFDIAELD